MPTRKTANPKKSAAKVSGKKKSDSKVTAKPEKRPRVEAATPVKEATRGTKPGSNRGAKRAGRTGDGETRANAPRRSSGGEVAHAKAPSGGGRAATPAPARKIAPSGAHFTPELFRFLRDLAANNSRPWFDANKSRYEDHVKAPLLHFIADMADPLRTISRSFVADSRPVGGSMFRIYRDTRFSKDKSPYKTMASAHFRHRVGKDVHAPGFYVHLEPGQVFVGTGLWHPEPADATKIRESILERSAEWKRVTGAKSFRDRCELVGDSLVRPPRGVPADHPLLEDLKRKDFISVANFNEKDACSKEFLPGVVEAFRAAGPFMKFLTEAVGLEW